MRMLNVARNNLSMSIPSGLGALSNLLELDLSDNQFTGFIPEELGFTTDQLRKLSLNGNLLSGPVPTTFENLGGIRALFLQSNNIRGTMPSSACELFNVTLPSIYIDCEEINCPCCNFCCIDEIGCDCRYMNTVDEWMCF